MPNTRSGASMTHEEVEELVTRRVAEEMEAREAAINLEPLNENGDEQEGGNRGNGNGSNRGNGNGGNGGNGNGGNGGNGNGGNRGNRNGGNGENRNGNRNGNHGMKYGGFMPVARECTFQDFLKCKPHNFSGTEGIVGLTHWFEKMETMFNISNCPPKCQVKYATCTLQDNALTWTMPNTRSGASRTREGVNEQINRRLAGALGARDATRNLEPLIGDGGEQGNGNGNGGANGNGNGNEGNGYNFGGFMPARECTYQDFLKFQPLSFNRMEGVVGLARWFKKMETVFHISNCPEKYQVKYAMFTLLNSALT
ncbi:hypothetical protein Tco_0498715 [Tanacetum coccineum]